MNGIWCLCCYFAHSLKIAESEWTAINLTKYKLTHSARKSFNHHGIADLTAAEHDQAEDDTPDPMVQMCHN